MGEPPGGSSEMSISMPATGLIAGVAIETTPPSRGNSPRLVGAVAPGGKATWG